MLSAAAAAASLEFVLQDWHDGLRDLEQAATPPMPNSLQPQGGAPRAEMRSRNDLDSLPSSARRGRSRCPPPPPPHPHHPHHPHQMRPCHPHQMRPHPTAGMVRWCPCATRGRQTTSRHGTLNGIAGSRVAGTACSRAASRPLAAPLSPRPSPAPGPPLGAPRAHRLRRRALAALVGADARRPSQLLRALPGRRSVSSCTRRTGPLHRCRRHPLR